MDLLEHPSNRQRAIMDPMQRYIAFLRGINVGGHTVKMADLRMLFASLRFEKVETFIASGNVIFESSSEDQAALEKQIEGTLKEALGYEVATFLRTPAELAAIAAYQLFPEAEPAIGAASLYVLLLPMPLTDEVEHQVAALHTPTDEFHCHGREIYWLCRTRLSESTLFSSTLLARTIGLPNTMRNITTIKKLTAKYPVP